MSKLCFDACVSLALLNHLFKDKKLPVEIIKLISEYNKIKSLHKLKQLMLHYSPKPILQSLEEGKEYLALQTVDEAFNGCAFYLEDHQKRMEGVPDPVIMQVRSMIETRWLESDRDFYLAHAAVLRYYWTQTERIWLTLSVENMCFFFFFGGLGGHILHILEVLKDTPPRQKNTLTMFALLGFLNLEDCSVELPEVEFSVVERLAEFLQGHETLKNLICVLRRCTRASWPKPKAEEAPEEEPSAKRARV